MKLSEAIRLGAKAKPQVFGMTSGNGGTCAIGAALESIGHADEDYTQILKYFPIMSSTAMHPVTGESVLMLTITRELNDEYRWTRERIARFVKRVEKVFGS